MPQTHDQWRRSCREYIDRRKSPHRGGGIPKPAFAELGAANAELGAAKKDYPNPIFAVYGGGGTLILQQQILRTWVLEFPLVGNFLQSTCSPPPPHSCHRICLRKGLEQQELTLDMSLKAAEPRLGAAMTFKNSENSMVPSWFWSSSFTISSI